MIITKLIGGIGNQMFQYAIARSIAYTNQTDFKMDITGFETYTLREYELGHFNIIEHFAKNEEIQRYKEKKSFCTAFFGKLFPNLQDYRYYKEKRTFHYDPGVFKLKGNVYLDGYWQTEKYFKSVGDIIKNDFTVKTEPDEKNRALLDNIKNCNAVAVHIRRGDYVLDPQISSRRGTCSLNYYRKSVDIIAKRISDPHFFVFSDDPKWTKENIKIDFPTTYITHNEPNKGYEDLRLMRHCNHFIIANSSFSWWGAWLSRNSDKMVLAPKRWKKDGTDTKDLIPGGWLRI
jgi:hypothetical protein